MSELLAVSVTFNLFLLYRYLVLHSDFRKTVRVLFYIAEGKLEIKKTKDGWEAVEVKQA